MGKSSLGRQRNRIWRRNNVGNVITFHVDFNPKMDEPFVIPSGHVLVGKHGVKVRLTRQYKVKPRLWWRLRALFQPSYRPKLLVEGVVV